MSHIPGRAFPLPPAWHLVPPPLPPAFLSPHGCVMGAAPPPSLCSRAGWDPFLRGARPFPPPLAGHSALQLLPSFPRGLLGTGCLGSLPCLVRLVPGRGAEVAGGGQGAAGRGEAESADCRARAASGTLFLATHSPGVLSFTHLFTAGLRGR